MKKAPVPTPALIEAAKLTMIAMAAVDVIRPKVVKIQTDLINRLDIRYVDKLEGRRGVLPETGQKITNPHHLYMADDEDQQKYYLLLDEAYKGAGWTLQPGYCPLLMAESQRGKAKNLMAREACKVLPGFSYETLEYASVAQYEKFIDLVLKYVGPFVKAEGTGEQILTNFLKVNDRTVS